MEYCSCTPTAFTGSIPAKITSAIATISAVASRS